MNSQSIELINISKSFREQQGERLVLSNVNYSFRPNNVYLIKGRSGSGKSTLLSLLGLIDKPTQGKVLFFGKELVTQKQRERFRGQNIAFLFQDGNFLPYLSGEDNLSLIGPDITKKNELAKTLGIDGLLSKPTASLSKGEGARLSLARAFLEDKPILLLDEPAGNLDEKNARKVYDLIKKASKGRIIVVVSHDFSFFDDYPSFVPLEIKNHQLSGETGVISNGKILAPHSIKPLRGKIVSHFIKELYRKTRWKTALYFFLSILLPFFAFYSLSLSSFNPNEELAKAYDASGLGSLSLISESSPAGAFRSFTPSIKDADGNDVSLSIAYGSSPSLFYKGLGEINEQTVYVPSFEAEEANLKTGDILSFEGAFGSISRRVSIVSIDKNSLTTPLDPAILHSSYPAVVGTRFASDYASVSEIPLATGSLKPLKSLLANGCSLPLNEGYFIVNPASYSISGSTLSNDETAVVLPASLLSEEIQTYFNAYMKGKTLSFIATSQDAVFNPSKVFSSYVLKELIGVPDSLTDGKVSLLLSSSMRSKFLSSLPAIGMFASSLNSWQLPASEFDSQDLLSFSLESSPVVNDKTIAGYRAIASSKPYLYALSGVLAIFALASVIFYSSILDLAFKDEKTLLSAIGQKPTLSFFCQSLAEGLISLISLLLSLGFAVGLTFSVVQSSLNAFFGLSGVYLLSFWPFIPLIILLFYTLAIVLTNLINMATRKANLSEEIKKAKE